MNAMETVNALSAPFDQDEVKAKPKVVSGNRAMAIFYIDARCIMDRLDEVMGPGGWFDEYEFLPDGCALCKLSLWLNDQWICKMDVGGESEQPDGGDRRKAAISDALKRTAVKFGIGRYLYRLPLVWADYDPQKKRFVNPPQLPASPKKPAVTPASKRNGTALNAKQEAEVSIWQDWLKKLPDLPTINKNLPDLAQVKDPATKKRVWEMIQDYAQRYKWEWDAKGKVFNDCQPLNA